jgi:hypothetical protein
LQPFPLEALAEAEPPLAVAAVGNDWFGSTLLQFIAQFVAVVRLVAEQAFGWVNSIDKAFCDRAIVRLTAGQQ